MRILHVIPAYLPAVRYGGTSVAAHGLCRALAARGHHVQVFTTNIDGPGSCNVPLRSSVLLDGVNVTYFPLTTLRRICWSRSLGSALYAHIVNFDVVHLHSVFLWPTWAAARQARKVKVPYVISPHGMLVKRLINQRSRVVKSAWIRLIEKKNLKAASAIHATSRIEAEELLRFGWQLPKIEIIPNGVDEIKRFERGDELRDIRRLTTEAPLVLFLGRLSWVKGLDRLLKAFALTEVGNLAIVGPDDEKLMPRLLQLARELQIADRVRFLPRMVLGADKEHLYRSANVLVLPSYSENFGITAIEAMWRGVPVLVTPEVGVADIVRESGGGLVASGDSETFGAAIRRLTEDRSFAYRLGQAGHRHATAHYTWDRIAAQMEVIYESLELHDRAPEVSGRAVG